MLIEVMREFRRIEQRDHGAAGVAGIEPVTMALARQDGVRAGIERLEDLPLWAQRVAQGRYRIPTGRTRPTAARSGYPRPINRRAARRNARPGEFRDRIKRARILRGFILDQARVPGARPRPRRRRRTDLITRRTPASRAASRVSTSPPRLTARMVDASRASRLRPRRDRRTVDHAVTMARDQGGQMRMIADYPRSRWQARPAGRRRRHGGSRRRVNDPDMVHGAACSKQFAPRRLDSPMNPALRR